MKKYLRICCLVSAILLLLIGCRKEFISQLNGNIDVEPPLDTATDCGTAIIKELWDMGGAAKRGNVVIVNDNNNITLKITADGPVYVKKIIAVYGSQEHVRLVMSQTNQWTPCDGPLSPDRTKTSEPQLHADSLQIPNTFFQNDNCVWIGLFITLTDDSGFEWCAFPKPFDDSLAGISAWKTLFKYCRQECPPPLPGACIPVQKELRDQNEAAKRGNLTITNDNNNITFTVSTFSNLLVKKMIAVYGTKEHVESVLTATNLWTPCAGPTEPDRVKMVDGNVFRDTMQIPNSVFGDDNCVWIAFYVTIANKDGFTWCTFPRPFDDSIPSVSRWKSFFQYCRQDCPEMPQSCDGTLEDPIVNITFGSGENPGDSLEAVVPGASTSLKYVAVSGNAAFPIPLDGSYTITNNVPANDFWFLGAADHTPDDNNGFMAFFNAPATAGLEFYRQEISGLSASTTYEVATWFANCLNAALGTGVKPDITFSIEQVNGSVLATFNAGPIAEHHTLTWERFAFFFATPSGVTTIVLKMTNNNPGGSEGGNDFAMDDITLRPCRR